jgi:hypothetical protein
VCVIVYIWAGPQNQVAAADVVAHRGWTRGPDGLILYIRFGAGPEDQIVPFIILGLFAMGLGARTR